MIIYYYLHDSRHSKHKKQIDRAVKKTNNDCHLVTCFATTVTSAQDVPSHRGNIRD